jgi:hypothetical protein
MMNDRKLNTINVVLILNLSTIVHLQSRRAHQVPVTLFRNEKKGELTTFTHQMSPCVKDRWREKETKLSAAFTKSGSGRIRQILMKSAEIVNHASTQLHSYSVLWVRTIIQPLLRPVGGGRASDEWWGRHAHSRFSTSWPCPCGGSLGGEPTAMGEPLSVWLG